MVRLLKNCNSTCVKMSSPNYFRSVFLLGLLFYLLLCACNPGERPAGSSASETKESDSIVSHYSADSLHKYRQDTGMSR